MRTSLVLGLNATCDEASLRGPSPGVGTTLVVDSGIRTEVVERHAAPGTPERHPCNRGEAAPACRLRVERAWRRKNPGLSRPVTVLRKVTWAKLRWRHALEAVGAFGALHQALAARKDLILRAREPGLRGRVC